MEVAVAYSIWYQKGRSEYNKISKNEVDQEITKWLL